MSKHDDYRLEGIKKNFTLRPEGLSADYGKYVSMAGFHDNGMFTTGRAIEDDTLEAFYASMNTCGKPAARSTK